MSINRAVVFDLDGVLLDSESDTSWLQNAAEKTLAYFDVDIKSFAEFLYSTHVPHFRKISEKIGIDAEVLWPVRNRLYTEEKLNAMKDRVIGPFPDISRLYDITDVFELGIVSNSPQVVVDFFIEEFGYDDLFSFGIGRGDGLEDIERMKPHPHLFTKLFSVSTVTRFLYVGDRKTDQLFAERTGMDFVFLNRHQNKANGFSSLVDLVVFLQSQKKE